MVCLLLLVSTIIIIQNIKADGITHVNVKPPKHIYAGEGQTCSTPTFTIDCQEGLTCATEKFITYFNPNLETAKCIKTELVIDLGSKVWSKEP